MPLFKGTTPPAGGTFADRVRKAGEHRSSSEDDARAVRPRGERLPRQPVFANATLTHEAGKMACVVTNWNKLGARVEFTSNLTLRGKLSLMAPVLGINTAVRVAWQKGGSAGLIFVKSEAGAR